MDVLRRYQICLFGYTVATVNVYWQLIVLPALLFSEAT